MKENNQAKLRQINNVATQTSSVGSDPDNCMPKAEYERLCKEGKLTKSVYVCGEGMCLPPVHVYGCSSGVQPVVDWTNWNADNWWNFFGNSGNHSGANSVTDYNCACGCGFNFGEGCGSCGSGSTSNEKQPDPNKINVYPQGLWNYRNLDLRYTIAEGVGITGSLRCDITIGITGYGFYVYAAIIATTLHGAIFGGTVEVYQNGNHLYSQLTLPESYYYTTGTIPVGSFAFELPKTGHIEIFLNIGFQRDSGIGFQNGNARKKIFDI